MQTDKRKKGVKTATPYLKSGRERKQELLQRAVECWVAMEGFRRERDRCKRFTYGDQWSDPVDVDEQRVREDEYILKQGNMPLKNNLIRRLVRNVLGVFRNEWEQPRCRRWTLPGMHDTSRLNDLLHYNLDRNRMEEVYARSMEEFLISGLAVHRKWYGLKGGVVDCWTDPVQPDNFFWDTESRDICGWDMNIIGEIHDMEYQKLEAEFGYAPDLPTLYPGLDSERPCRVIEVWSRRYVRSWRIHDHARGVCWDSDEEVRKPGVTCEPIGREKWEYHFLTPDGTVLQSGLSPYSHGSHPFVVKAYPFIDGEIHSFVSDVIDQQKFTNRLISMYDWILRASAKGVLLFPEESLPEGVDINDVADEWSRFNGVIIYRPKPGVPQPAQVSSNCTNIGIAELLQIQLKMMEDVSGVNGALQGKLDNNSMSGKLYDQQTRNAMTSLVDMLKSFNAFVADATEMDIANIMQYYSTEKIAEITENIKN